MTTKPVDFKRLSAHKTPEDSPGFLLWRTSTLWRRSIEAVLKPLGLTHPQFVVLAVTAWLTKGGVKVSQAEIAREASLDANTTSQILRSLQAKELIERPRTVDERSKCPLLTVAGKESLSKALPTVEKADADFFALLPKQSILIEILQSLSQRKPA